MCDIQPALKKLLIPDLLYHSPLGGSVAERSSCTLFHKLHSLVQDAVGDGWCSRNCLVLVSTASADNADSSAHCSTSHCGKEYASVTGSPRSANEESALSAFPSSLHWATVAPTASGMHCSRSAKNNAKTAGSPSRRSTSQNRRTTLRGRWSVNRHRKGSKASSITGCPETLKALANRGSLSAISCSTTRTSRWKAVN